MVRRHEGSAVPDNVHAGVQLMDAKAVAGRVRKTVHAARAFPACVSAVCREHGARPPRRGLRRVLPG